MHAHSLAHLVCAQPFLAHTDALLWGGVGLQDCPAGDLHSFWWNHKLRTEAGAIFDDADAPEDVRRAFQPDEQADFRYRQYAGAKVHRDGDPLQHSQAPSQRKEHDNHRDRGKGKTASASASTSATTSASATTNASACASSTGSSRKDVGGGKSKGRGKSQEAGGRADSDKGKGKSKGKARSAGTERSSKKQAAARTSKQTMLEELAEAADVSSMEEDLEEGVQEGLWEVMPALSSPAQAPAVHHGAVPAQRKQTASKISRKRLRMEEELSPPAQQASMAGGAQAVRTHDLQELRSMVHTEVAGLLSTEVQKLLQELGTVREEQQRLYRLQEECRQQVQECLQAMQSMQQQSSERHEERRQLQELCQQYAQNAQRMPDQDTLARLASVAQSASSVMRSRGAEDPFLSPRSVFAAPSPAASSTSSTAPYAAAAPYAPSPPLPADATMHAQPMPARTFRTTAQQPAFFSAHGLPPAGATAMAPAPHWQEEQEFSPSMPQVQEQQVAAQYVPYASSTRPAQPAAQPWAQPPPQVQQAVQLLQQYQQHMAGSSAPPSNDRAQQQRSLNAAQQQPDPSGFSSAGAYRALPPYAPPFPPPM